MLSPYLCEFSLGSPFSSQISAGLMTPDGPWYERVCAWIPYDLFFILTLSSKFVQVRTLHKKADDQK